MSGGFTKGPWLLELHEKCGTIDIYGPRRDGETRQSDGCGPIAEIDCADGEDRLFPPLNAESVANARLISAAPTMLDALASLDAVLDFGEPGSDEKPLIFEDWSDLNAAFQKARAAIAKATGSTP